jgi:chemotaxis protein MotB
MADQPIIIKKIKKGGHGHHGGAWKVAFADFVTAMMAFFMVMWIVSMSGEDRAVIQAYFNDPVGFAKDPPKHRISLTPRGVHEKAKSLGESSQRAVQKLDSVERTGGQIEAIMNEDQSLKELAMKGSLEMRITAEGLVIEFVESEMNGEVFFQLGSAEIRPGAQEVIAKVARLLAESGHKVKFQGHTDGRPMNGPLDNWTLSAARANAVRLAMAKAGLPESNILAVDGFADRKPRRADDPLHFSNRRVSVLLPYAMEPETIEGLPKSGFTEERESHFRKPASGSAAMPKPINLAEGVGGH